MKQIYKKMLMGAIALIAVMIAFQFTDMKVYAATDKVITEVKITFPDPAEKGKTDFSLATVKAYVGSEEVVGKTKAEANWYIGKFLGTNPKGFDKLDVTDNFAGDGTYKLDDGVISAFGGYSFADDVVVTLNGEKATTDVDFDIIRFSGQQFYLPILVSLDMQGHGQAPELQYVSKYCLYLPENLTDGNWVLEGWYYDENLTKGAGSIQFVYNDTTFYSKWIQKYDAELTFDMSKFDQNRSLYECVSLNINGKKTTGLTSCKLLFNGEEITPARFHYDETYKIVITVTLPSKDSDRFNNVVVKENDDFVGLTKDIRENVLIVSFDYYFTQEHPYYILFEMNGHGEQVQDIPVNSFWSVVNIPEPVETDPRWKMTGWYTSPDFSEESKAGSSLTNVKKDTVLYAKWERTIKITYVIPLWNEKIETYSLPDIGFFEEGAYESFKAVTEIIDHNGMQVYCEGTYADPQFDKKVYKQNSVGNTDRTIYLNYYYVVDDMAFTIRVPVLGQKARFSKLYSVTTNFDNHITVGKDGHWQSKSAQGWGEMDPDSVFEAGNDYRFGPIKIEAITNKYILSRYPAVTVNGEKANPTIHWDYNQNWERVIGYYYLNFSFPSTLSFDMNGHGEQIPMLELQNDAPVPEPEKPTCLGYRFTGWYFDGRLFDFTQNYSGTITLVAAWEPIIDRLDVQCNIPRLNTRAKSEIAGIIVNEEPDVSLDFSTLRIQKSSDNINWTAMYDGEEFLPGFYYQIQFSINKESEIPFADDYEVLVSGEADGVTITESNNTIRVVYTKYLEKTTHKITYVMNGNGTAIPDTVAEEGLIPEFPEDPTDPNAEFCGWYTDPEFSTGYEFTGAPLFEDITLYAKWKYKVNAIGIELPEPMAGKYVPMEIDVRFSYGTDGSIVRKYSVYWQSGEPSGLWDGSYRGGFNYYFNSAEIALPSDDYYMADNITVDTNFGIVSWEILDSNSIIASLNVTVEGSGSGFLVPNRGTPTPVPTEVPTPSPEPEDNGNKLPVWPFVAGGVLLIACIVIPVVLTKRKKK